MDEKRFRLVNKCITGTLLDIGCSTGQLLRLHSGTGLEINREKAIQALPFGNIAICDIETTLPLKDKSADTVTCLEVLEHLQDPKALVKEMVRVCRKRLIITVPYVEWIQYHVCVYCNKQTPHNGHLHSFTRESLLSLLPREIKSYLLDTISTKPRYVPKLHKIPRIPLSLLPLSISFSKVLDRPSKKMWFLLIANV